MRQTFDLKTDSLIDLFLNSDSFYNCTLNSLVKVQTNYCNNNLLIFYVKQLNKTTKLYYFHTLKALWDDLDKIEMYYGMLRVKKRLVYKGLLKVLNYFNKI